MQNPVSIDNLTADYGQVCYCMISQVNTFRQLPFRSGKVAMTCTELYTPVTCDPESSAVQDWSVQAVTCRQVHIQGCVDRWCIYSDTVKCRQVIFVLVDVTCYSFYKQEALPTEHTLKRNRTGQRHASTQKGLHNIAVCVSACVPVYLYTCMSVFVCACVNVA